MKNLFFLILILISSSPWATAQELNCEVQIIHPQIQGVNPAIFESMEEMIFEFLNNRQWTADKFSIEERIECSIILNIQDARASSNNYKAELQIISSRPIFNTDYSSPVLSLKDVNVEFDYIPGTQYNFNPDQFENNLMSVLAFYAYMMIGYDYDTYSLEGGTPYFNMAQRIVQSAQGTNATGWKAYEGDKNRYWLVDNILHRTFEPLRQTLYEYHMKGLDIMSEKTEMGRLAIKNSLDRLEKIHQLKPMSYNTQVFFLAKSDELVNIFSPAPVPMKAELATMLARIDPGNLSKYERMEKGR